MRLEINLSHQRQAVVLIYLLVPSLSNNNNQLSSSSSNNLVDLTHLAITLNNLLVVLAHFQVRLQFSNSKHNPKLSMHSALSHNNHNSSNNRQAASVLLARHHPKLNNREDSMHLVVLKASSHRPSKIHLELLETHQHQLLLQISMHLAVLTHQVP